MANVIPFTPPKVVAVRALDVADCVTFPFALRERVVDWEPGRPFEPGACVIINGQMHYLLREYSETA